MGRAIKGWWNEERGVWYAKAGELGATTGKRKAVILCGEDGQPVGAGDQAGADAALARILAKRDRSDGPTVADVARSYVAWHKSEGSAERTIQGHWYQLSRFARFGHGGRSYGDMAARDIVPKDLWRFKQSGKGQIRQLYMSVLACWKWAARPVEGREPEIMIPANPLKDMIRPKKGPPQGVTEWPVAKRILILARSWARQRPRTRRVRTRAGRWVKAQALAMIAHSGARTAEAVTLEWTDIRWDESVAEIPVGRHKTGSRTGRIRRFPVNPVMMRVLRKIQRWPNRHQRFVFATRWQSEPKVKDWWDWIRKDLKPWLAKHGVELPPKWRPYTLRHSYGTTALEAVGADLAASALGHSPEVLKSTYDHVSATRVRQVGEAVEKARKQKLDQTGQGPSG